MECIKCGFNATVEQLHSVRLEKILEEIFELIDKNTGKEQVRLNELPFPMEQENVSICLQNLAVEIKKELTLLTGVKG